MSESSKIVREFRHVLLWPLQLRRLPRRSPPHWDVLAAHPGPWKPVADNLLVDDDSCGIGYEEFVYFLPYVQRFLYGFGEADAFTPSSLRIFKRDDIAKIRVRLDPESPPVEFDVTRLRLVFFYDVDITLLALEIVAHDLPLDLAIETMDRFGRPYPPKWETPDQAAHCTHQVEFFDAKGELIAASDYGDRDKYLSLVRDIKQTPLSLHWEYLLKPMMPAYLGGGPIQYYQIENKRIPIMSYLSFDNPRALTLGDFARIGFAAKWGESQTLPYSRRFLSDFEARHCYDRYWDEDDPTSGMNTRYMFCGVAYAMVTKYRDDRTDLLSNFRHQFFQIGLIANFHKAALLNLSNRFSIAVERLRVGDYDSARIFKTNVREALELFLRFNHRYWFHEISNQVLAADMFQRWSHELGSDRLYSEVREEAQDINQYLDAERMRRTSDNAQRLTVVSACGMVGMVATGFLGMNLYDHASYTAWEKTGIFMLVFIPAILLTGITVLISRRLATFMEALSSERMTWGEKLTAFRQIWRRPPAVRPPQGKKRVAGGEASRRVNAAPRSSGQGAHD
ncbi:hypothetical protein [Usitatibacter palustris]|uniref:CorA-like Mg2+ transporter protein n=1 Tax=Usitatibacter palustris TaxID=2732487 RepID=A0A6M4H9C0_9PROT|nr:hypothetical protein [Usitatibacter palustris]QJR15795.1 hypothetical protein DSM104440_02621 [Usitatibacter palustris]